MSRVTHRLMTNDHQASSLCHQSSRPESQRRVLSEHFMGESTYLSKLREEFRTLASEVQITHIYFVKTTLFIHVSLLFARYIILLMILCQATSVSWSLTLSVVISLGTLTPGDQHHHHTTKRHQDLQTPASSPVLVGRLPLNIGVERGRL